MRTRIARLTSGNRVLVARNPKSGAGKNSDHVAGLAKQLTARGFAVEVITEFDTLISQTNEANSRSELRAIISAGGDGTLNALVNRLPAGIPMLVLPLGTENLLAKYLGLSSAAEELAAVLEAGWTFEFDAGRVNDRLFLLMFSCGLDADVVHRLHAIRAGHISHWSYFKPLWEALRKYSYPPFSLRTWGEGQAANAIAGNAASPDSNLANLGSDAPAGTEIWSARWAFVSNLPCYAGQLRVAPRAVGFDELLDLCAFQGGSFWNSWRYLIGVLFGRHHKLPDCRVAQFRRLRIESDAPVPYQIDGDPGGTLPVTIEVVPRQFRAVVPQAWLKQHGLLE